MDGPPASPRRGPRVAHIVVRLLLVVALVVLLVLNGVKQAPRLLTLVAARPTTTVAAPASSGVTDVPTTVESDTPTPAETPSSAAPVETGGTTGGGGAAPVKTSQPKAVITELTSSGDVACLPPATDAPGATTPVAPEVTVHWRSTGGVGDAYFGINTRDAQAAPYSTVHQSDSITLTFPCGERQQLYTVTVLSPGGKTSRSITVHNTGSVG